MSEEKFELTEEQKEAIKKIMEYVKTRTASQLALVIEQCGKAVAVWCENLANWLRQHAKEIDS